MTVGELRDAIANLPDGMRVVFYDDVLGREVENVTLTPTPPVPFVEGPALVIYVR